MCTPAPRKSTQRQELGYFVPAWTTNFSLINSAFGPGLVGRAITQLLQSAALPADSLRIKYFIELESTKGETILVKLFKFDRTFREPISKLTTFFMVVFHLGAIGYCFRFTWK